MMSKSKKYFPFISLLSALLFLSACVESPSSGRRGDESAAPVETGSGGGSGGGSGSGPSDGSIGSDAGVNFSAGRTELRFIVDPFSGTYKNKVTIPKNFTGDLYLSGLNVTALSDRIIRVRFNFGRELEPVIIPATIVRGSGITPQTDIEVLALSMDDRPFEEIRLLYNLFDYNDYRDENGNETLQPVSDPRDGNLFCRGLRLQHDPTFEGSSTNTLCDGVDGFGNPNDERCLYAYAKVVDTGLYTQTPSFGKIPTEPQIDLTLGNGLGYNGDSLQNQLKKCLPDNINRENIEGVMGLNFPNPGSALLGQEIAGAGDYDIYRGPFRPIGEWTWEIMAGALFSEVSSTTGPRGLFQHSMDGTVTTGYRSFLFPRAGKMNLAAGVEHWSSAEPFGNPAVSANLRGARDLQSLLTSGNTEYMDGCNLRVSNYNSFTNEGLSSCNVTGTIDIITTNPETGATEIIASSTDVKLQLIRPSITNFRGEEVLYSSMRTCSSSSACGTGECCFNSRCWSKELVSQCLEDVPVVGNRAVGEVCNSDFACSSLCCNQSTGTCGVHINTEDEQVLCSKAPGQQCVSKEYCRREFIPECFVVKTGTDNLGNQACALRCYNVPTFGNCRNGICTPPLAKPVPAFDPLNPDCSEAIDPPNF